MEKLHVEGQRFFFSMNSHRKDHGGHENFSELDGTFQRCLPLLVVMEAEVGPKL